MPSAILTLEVIDYKPKGFKAIAVALANRQVQLYKEKFLVDVIHTEDVVTGLRFGRFAREDGTLVMATKCKRCLSFFV
jgi:Bardet-Biedl syndrome 1 protein